MQITIPLLNEKIIQGPSFKMKRANYFCKNKRRVGTSPLTGKLQTVTVGRKVKTAFT